MPVVGQRSWTSAQVRENTRAMGVKKHQDGAPLIPQSGEHGPVEKPKNLLDDERNLVVFSASPAAPPSQAPLSVIGDPRLWSGERMWWGGVGAVSRPRIGRLGSLRCTCCRCYLPTSRLCSCAGKNQSRLGRPSVFDVRGGLGVVRRPSVASGLAPWVVAHFPLESHHPS